MVVGSDELERMAAEAYLDRAITGSLYCGDCGYNLHTLPYLYVCPECGNKYDARPLSMKGIFAPHEVEIPFRDVVAALACGVSSFILGNGAFSPPDLFRLSLGLVFAVFGAMFAWHAYVRTGRFVKGIVVMRRIEREQEEAE